MSKSVRILAIVVSILQYSVGQLVAQDQPRSLESPPTLEFRLADDAESSGWPRMPLRGSDKPIFVSPDACLNGSHIEKVSFYKDHNGRPSVGISLTDEGAKAMEATTSKNLKRRLAIVLNGKVLSAPTIQSTIAKEVQITGKFDRDDMLSFFHAIVLRELP